MKIRLVLHCSQCGSHSFRPSSQVTLKDAVLQKFGVIPQRCFLCRRRFYLFKPLIKVVRFGDGVR
jgi:hypothetical protein